MDRDIEATVKGETSHDQLPSVEEAKLDATLDSSVASPKRTSAIRQAVWIIFSVSIAVALLFVVTVVVISKKDESPSAIANPSESDFLDPAQEKVVEVLKTVSEYEALLAPGSPQNRAATWIAHDQLGEFYLADHDIENLTQRYIMAVLFFALDGENWGDDLGFLTTKDVCRWSDTKLDSNVLSDSMFIGVWCNDDGKVQDLRFRKYHRLTSRRSMAPFLSLTLPMMT